MQHLSLEPSALEVTDLDTMHRFFEQVLELRPLVVSATGVTLELGGGDTTHVLMLLASTTPTPPRTINLEVSAADFPRLRQRLEQCGDACGWVRSWDAPDSASPQCAFRVVLCRLPEGHWLRLTAIDPSACRHVTLARTQRDTPRR
ncbi:hypothetical protein LCL99_19035 [Halomonas denitrificans]|uniref:hypothetical protein n=1 Tax=Halomonas denitrificans TaxID=370769 RepID=UPI001CD2B1A1|nr:hypothetical protein [Halomonas denitrificans]MCA0976569.1 hypothetical protein [Halomonas denitrificans]